jgi:hypothetical protein
MYDLGGFDPLPNRRVYHGGRDARFDTVYLLLTRFSIIRSDVFHLPSTGRFRSGRSGRKKLIGAANPRFLQGPSPSPGSAFAEPSSPQGERKSKLAD